MTYESVAYQHKPVAQISQTVSND